MLLHALPPSLSPTLTFLDADVGAVWFSLQCVPLATWAGATFSLFLGGSGSTHFFFEMHDWGDCFFMPRTYKVEADGSVGAKPSREERFRTNLSFATIDRHDRLCLDSTVEPFHNHSHFQNHGLLAGTAAAQLESASYSPGKDIVLPTANAFYPGLPGTDSANIKKVLDEIGRQTDGRGVDGTGSDREYLLVFVMGNDFETRLKVYHHLRAVGRGTPAENMTAGCDTVDCEYRTASASKAPYRVCKCRALGRIVCFGESRISYGRQHSLGKSAACAGSS